MCNSTDQCRLLNKTLINHWPGLLDHLIAVRPWGTRETHNHDRQILKMCEDRHGGGDKYVHKNTSSNSHIFSFFTHYVSLSLTLEIFNTEMKLVFI